MAGATLTRSEVLADVTGALRIAQYVQRDGDCLRWTGVHNPAGYGRISIRGRLELVHRVAYELHVGPIPPGLELDHVRARGCRFRDCFNVEHLEPVTRLENSRRANCKTHCIQGHELTPATVYLASDGKRECRVCKARHARNSRSRNRLATCTRCGKAVASNNLARHKRSSACAPDRQEATL